MSASSSIKAGDQASAEGLLDAFKTIDDAGRARHATVLDYWLSIRGTRELPPLRDLDPLKLTDAGPDSVLLELIGGGEDATIRYIGASLKPSVEAEHISEASRPSLLASIAKKLSIIAISRNFLAFEDEFASGGATTRCWVTLLPLSSAGAWVDYVYAFVTFDANAPAMPAEAEPEAQAPGDSDVLELAAEDAVAVEDGPEPHAELPAEEPEASLPEPEEALAEEPAEAPAQATSPSAKKPGYAFAAIAAAGGFYAKAVKGGPKAATPAPAPAPAPEEAPAPTPPESKTPVEEEPLVASQEQPAPLDQDEPMELEEPVAEPVAEEAPAPVAEETPAPVAEEAPAPAPKHPEPSSAPEGTLQSKLDDVRAKADEARQAKLRANSALYEGLSAAYDFALDAESSPEEYLKMCEAKGLKIQLRSPMKPVATLAFDGMCDDSTIAQLEAVLAWALKHDLPKGSLAERIEEEGGLAPILGHAKAA